MSIRAGDRVPIPNFTLAIKKKYRPEVSKAGMGTSIFSMASTGTWTERHCTLRDDLGNYRDRGAEVMGIPVNYPLLLAQCKEDQGFNFDLLPNFNKGVSQQFGSYGEEFVGCLEGGSKRAALVVDKSGTVRYAEVIKNAGKLPDFQKPKELLQDL